MPRPSLLNARPYASMDAFPNEAWHAYPDVLGLLPEYPERPNLETVMRHMPAWMDTKACAEVRERQSYDPDNGGVWWANAWARMPAGIQDDPHTLVLMMATAVVYGWPTVAAALRERGASTAALLAPADEADRWSGWRWGATKVDERQRDRFPPAHAFPMSALAFSVAALRSDNTVTPLAPEQRQALVELIEAGADPNQVAAPVLRAAIKHEALIGVLIEHGLDPYLPTTDRRGQDAGPLITALLNVDLTLAKAARERIFKRFLREGMPSTLPDGRSLVQVLCDDAPGTYLLPATVSHYGYAIADDLVEHAGLIQKRAKRMKVADRALFEGQLLEAKTAPAAPAAGKRGPRL